jgi:hypothetical protein
MDARSDHASLVEDKQVILAQELAQVTKDAVFYVSVIAVQDQQTRRIPWIDGGLRDHALRQVVVEVCGRDPR